MKRIFMCLAVALSMFSFQAKAQWVVADPTNLVQNIISAVQGTSTASNMINNLNESIKIYKQGKEYYDALKSVHNLIKDARKVQKTIEMVSEITDMYVTGFNKMVSDPNFSANELAAISTGYAKLLEEGGSVGNGFEKRCYRKQRAFPFRQRTHGRNRPDSQQDVGVP